MKRLLFPLLFGIFLNSYSQKVYTYSSKALTYSGDVLIQLFTEDYQAVYDAYTTKPDAATAIIQIALVVDLGT